VGVIAVGGLGYAGALWLMGLRARDMRH